MTEEGRKKLCKELRADNYEDAADQIERLANEVKLLEAAADFNSKEGERLDADRLNAEYQRDTALAELKDANLRLEGLAKRVEALEGRQEAMGRM